MNYSPRQLGDLTPTNPNRRQGLLAVFHVDLPLLVGVLLLCGFGLIVLSEIASRALESTFTPEFLETYDIPLLSGRNLDRNIANDTFVVGESETMNVLVNELTLARMGIENPDDAINQRLYRNSDEGTLREAVIVGVVPTQNILGLFNQEKPWVFNYSPTAVRIASIRITGGNMLGTIEDIERVWKRVIPDYPMQGRFLDQTFDEVYDVLKYMNVALGGFAFVALSLALIGLFGLAVEADAEHRGVLALVVVVELGVGLDLHVADVAVVGPDHHDEPLAVAGVRLDGSGLAIEVGEGRLRRLRTGFRRRCRSQRGSR